MNKRLLTITVHVAAWACFFLLPVVFFPSTRYPNYEISNAIIQMYVCIDLYLISFYYLNTQVLIPKLLTKRKWVWYALSVIVCFVLFASIPKIFENAIQLEIPDNVRMKMHRKHRPFLYPFTGSSAVFFLVLTISTCSRVIQEWLGIEKKKQEIEHEKLATELSFLKSQINPHFLFNTLNNIYSLALVKSDATADAVLKLSSIMRYVLSETKHDTVPLEKEIQFIKDYIELQKVRLTDKVTIQFLTEGNTEQKRIAPLILIPFVENAFKYGISAKEASAILFKLKAYNNIIDFTSQNNIVAGEKEKNEQTGIGLKNTKRRLELLYPEKHTLTVSKENNRFIVHLTLLQ
ncbi:MAG: sensor histidine kinase [Segetibacter sp.]